MKIAQRTKITQLQHETSTASVLLCVESFRNSEKCPSLFLAGNKRPVQAPNEKKNASTREKYQCLREAEAKNSETKFINFIASDQSQGTMAVR